MSKKQIQFARYEIPEKNGMQLHPNLNTKNTTTLNLAHAIPLNQSLYLMFFVPYQQYANAFV